MGKCQKTSSSRRGCSEKGEQYHLFHQHPVCQIPTSEPQIAASQDIPYIEDTLDKYESTTAADNGLKTIPQAAVTTDSAASTIATCTTGVRSAKVETTAPTTILSASTIGDVSVSPCQMTHIVQPPSPCVAIKRRNIFSCCSRKRGQQRRRNSASMSAAATGCCSGQHMSSGNHCYNQKVNNFDSVNMSLQNSI